MLVDEMQVSAFTTPCYKEGRKSKGRLKRD